ncbi:hypothetical protein [Caproiciproducens faecalis]|uniref:Uncharacterized protein n=1 Tax=Caproiciproducens faecalis TaxID=2820301 RepID=A0ABS7DRJ3_9FIRM|nr:hypothetical protein [Caproiciproducens faecalis]MBW7573919.1 hypothetical protein [Caproiciproducens faecalis]
MNPSEDPNDYTDYCLLKLSLACESFAAEVQEAFRPIIEPILQWVNDVVQKLQKWIVDTANLWKLYLQRIYRKPKTRKLVWLALYAKKFRTRKKNIHRILKILSK